MSNFLNNLNSFNISKFLGKNYLKKIHAPPEGSPASVQTDHTDREIQVLHFVVEGAPKWLN
jgi:hypothetical protein